MTKWFDVEINTALGIYFDRRYNVHWPYCMRNFVSKIFAEIKVNPTIWDRLTLNEKDIEDIMICMSSTINYIKVAHKRLIERVFRAILSRDFQFHIKFILGVPADYRPTWPMDITCYADLNATLNSPHNRKDVSYFITNTIDEELPNMSVGVSFYIAEDRKPIIIYVPASEVDRAREVFDRISQHLEAAQCEMSPNDVIEIKADRTKEEVICKVCPQCHQTLK